jgi:hypothetical protein
MMVLALSCCAATQSAAAKHGMGKVESLSVHSQSSGDSVPDQGMKQGVLYKTKDGVKHN